MLGRKGELHPRTLLSAIEIESIKNNGVTEEELDFVKDKIYKSSKKDFQTSEDWINANSSREALCKDGKTNLDFINHMMVVSNSDIVKIANTDPSIEPLLIDKPTSD